MTKIKHIAKVATAYTLAIIIVGTSFFTARYFTMQIWDLLF